MFSDIRGIVFDLDGTLVDSAPDLAAAVNVVLRNLQLPSCSEPQVRTWVGNGADILLHRAMTGQFDGRASLTPHTKARQLFDDAYTAHGHRLSRVYPGVQEGLDALSQQGLPLACVTNKPSAFVQPMLTEFGLADFFALVVGGDDVPKKPAPDGLWYAARHLGIAIEQVLMVGDSSNDVKAARNAGCKVICVPYGYNHSHDIRSANPNAIIQSIAELPPLLRKAA